MGGSLMQGCARGTQSQWRAELGGFQAGSFSAVVHRLECHGRGWSPVWLVVGWQRTPRCLRLAGSPFSRAVAGGPSVAEGPAVAGLTDEQGSDADGLAHAAGCSRAFCSAQGFETRHHHALRLRQLGCLRSAACLPARQGQHHPQLDEHENDHAQQPRHSRYHSQTCHSHHVHARHGERESARHCCHGGYPNT